MDNKRELAVFCKDVNKTFYAKNRKQYQVNEVVKGLNLEVCQNEFLVIFGPGQ